MPISQPSPTWNATLGFSTNSTVSGFIGDLKEFFFANAYVNPSQVVNIKNQV